MHARRRNHAYVKEKYVKKNYQMMLTNDSGKIPSSNADPSDIILPAIAQRLLSKGEIVGGVHMKLENQTKYDLFGIH